MEVSSLPSTSFIAAAISPRLCGGILHAIATAIPAAPLSNRLGMRPGSTVGSLSDSSKLGAKSTVVLVEVGEHLLADRGEPRLGVTHGRGRVVIDRSVVSLTVNQRRAHAPGLRHPYHRLVHGDVAVWVVFSQHFADNSGALAIRLVGPHAEVVHRVQDAPLDGLEAVANVRQGPRNDHAHRVVEIRRAHLFDERLGADVASRFGYHFALRCDAGCPPTPLPDQI